MTVLTQDVPPAIFLSWRENQEVARQPRIRVSLVGMRSGQRTLLHEPKFGSLHDALDWVESENEQCHPLIRYEVTPWV